jgi:O-antigen ligase
LAFVGAALPALLLAYMVMIGGSAIGELYPTVRALNMVLAVVLIGAWAIVCRRGTDHLDVAVTCALVLFAFACVGSAFSRQSFDAAWLCTSYAAAFGLARRALESPSVRQFVLVAMAAMSLVFSTMTALRWLPDVATWVAIAGWQFPPLDFPFQTAPWGHRHDMALMVTMLLPAWLMLGRRRLVLLLASIAVAFTAVVVFLDGSRTLWIAIIVASAVVLGRTVWPRVKRLSSPQLWTLGASAVLLIIGAHFAGITERVLNLRTIAARGELWQAGIDAWLARPLTGQGPGSFPWVLQLTGYFNTNSWAPRHPDSAVIQLLAEVGMAGVLSATSILISVTRGMWQSRLASWALLCFGISCIAANPTDFGFLLAIAIAWAALAAPFKVETGSENGRAAVRSRHNRANPWLIGLALLPIAAGMALASFAEFAYQAAGRAVANSNLAQAEESLRTATSLDPYMALYHRTLGFVQWARSGPGESLEELQKAVETNGSDDFAFRILAAAAWASGDRARATKAIETAVWLQRSDTNNTLLAAKFYAVQRAPNGALDLVAETLQAHPTLALAPSWKEYVTGLGLTSDQVVAAALERWENRRPSPQPMTVEGLWLAALDDRRDLVARAQQEAPFAAELALAVSAALSCEDGKAAKALAQAPTPRDSYYWLVRIELAARRGVQDDDASTILRIMTGADRGNLDPVDVLSENTTPGFSLDAWGYRRSSILIGGLAGTLPSPGAGLTRWLNGRTEGMPCEPA